MFLWVAVKDPLQATLGGWFTDSFGKVFLLSQVTCQVQEQDFRSLETFNKVRFQYEERPSKGKESEQLLRMQGPSPPARIRAMSRAQNGIGAQLSGVCQAKTSIKGHLV